MAEERKIYVCENCTKRIWAIEEPVVCPYCSERTMKLFEVATEPISKTDDAASESV
jgi:DNA-directed RNA polymerase subunit RPC12/RpoP